MFGLRVACLATVELSGNYLIELATGAFQCRPVVLHIVAPCVFRV